ALRGKKALKRCNQKAKAIHHRGHRALRYTEKSKDKIKLTEVLGARCEMRWLGVSDKNSKPTAIAFYAIAVDFIVSSRSGATLSP
ncbi:hypothetical protein ACVBIL_16915, partial [Shewanella sp. 125m-7]